MEMHKKPWALPTICKMKARIDPTPDYQRPPAWSRKQKQLLMDTIFRNYDIPKFYWRKVSRDDSVQYEVVDGQQRLRAIWEFENDEFAFSRDTDPINGFDVASKKFSQLDPEVMEVFDTYSIDVVIITDAKEDENENEVRDMFLRLQNGTTLKAQEKRNAMTGSMRDFVKEVAKHPFLNNCKFSNARYTFDHISAQTILIELNGGPTNVKDADLNRMYKEHKDFDKKGTIARKVNSVFKFLQKAFPEKTPELERYNVINLYCLSSLLIERYVYQDLPESLANWFIEFECARREDGAKHEEDRELALVEYRRMTSYSTDTEESIRGRVDMFEQRFFADCPNIEPKDLNRDFSHEQRLAIYRKNDGICQIRIKCDGNKVAWDNWHADHIKSHSNGGKTTVSNGQVACASCNLSKGAS